MAPQGRDCRGDRVRPLGLDLPLRSSPVPRPVRVDPSRHPAQEREGHTGHLRVHARQDGRQACRPLWQGQEPSQSSHRSWAAPSTSCSSKRMSSTRSDFIKAVDEREGQGVQKTCRTNWTAIPCAHPACHHPCSRDYLRHTVASPRSRQVPCFDWSHTLVPFLSASISTTEFRYAVCPTPIPPSN
jgi:hypothetical protein